VDDLVQFLRERLDEDEAAARAATPGPWEQSGIGEYGWGVSFGRPGAGVEADDSDQGRADAEHIARHDPARVLVEVESKRQNLAELEAAEETMDRAARDRDTARYNAARAEWAVLKRVVLRDLVVYADHPALKPEWRP
jgi:hypothetical protein